MTIELALASSLECGALRRPTIAIMHHWPHAPLHQFSSRGTYMVTAGTYLKAHFFKSPDLLDLLQYSLLSLSKESGWQLKAWAIFSNHYHFIAESPKDPSNLKIWIAQLHQTTAHEVNCRDNTPNRKVWYQYWDSHITIQTSYLARMNYVLQNPVKHGLVSKATEYSWCSAAKFEHEATKSFIKSVNSFDYSKVKVFDDY